MWRMPCGPCSASIPENLSCRSICRRTMPASNACCPAPVDSLKAARTGMSTAGNARDSRSVVVNCRLRCVKRSRGGVPGRSDCPDKCRSKPARSGSGPGATAVRMKKNAVSFSGARRFCWPGGDGYPGEGDFYSSTRSMPPARAASTYCGSQFSPRRWRASSTTM